MQELPHDKAKSIGVANFDIHNLDILLKDPSTKIVLPSARLSFIHITHRLSWSPTARN